MAQRWYPKALVAVLAGAAAMIAPPGGELGAAAQSLSFTERLVPGPGRRYPGGALSPDVATLAGAPAVVVGDQGGHIYAFSLATGALVPGWPASTGGVPVESTPSVAALTPGPRTTPSLSAPAPRPSPMKVDMKRLVPMGP